MSADDLKPFLKEHGDPDASWSRRSTASRSSSCRGSRQMEPADDEQSIVAYEQTA